MAVATALNAFTSSALTAGTDAALTVANGLLLDLACLLVAAVRGYFRAHRHAAVRQNFQRDVLPMVDSRTNHDRRDGF